MRGTTGRIRVAAILGCLLFGPEAAATTQAHFWVGQANIANCSCGDVWPYADPDPMYRMVIFDNNSGATLAACGTGCSAGAGRSYDGVCSSDEEVCGSWNFPDYELVKDIPGNSGAYFYFGIFDDDADASDSMGDHWVYATASDASSHWEPNNNSSPYYPGSYLTAMCSGDVEGTGGASNWQLFNRIWFTDTTGPSTVPTPTHTDDALVTDWDNDTLLDFAWVAASDPDTGISGYRFDLSDVTAGTALFVNQVAPTDRTHSFCASGCDSALTPVHNHEYRYRIGATNGAFPGITNPATVWSTSVSTRVDLVNPASALTSPAAGSWQRSNFTVGFADTDDGAGIDPVGCRWQVVSSGSTTLAWTTRPCNGTGTATVGSSAYCRHQGANACAVSGDSVDLARRGSAAASRTFSIDWTGDAVTLTLRTSAGGPIIGPTDWTTDRDPYVEYRVDIASRYAPIAGYSWALDADPDCATLELGGGDSGGLQLPAGSLGAGVHNIRVRALDAAGNCGPVASHVVQVDDAPDVLGPLSVYTAPAGTPIASGDWQTDGTPYVVWATPPSSAPIAGYSYGVDSAQDCTPETTTTSFSAGPISDGSHAIWVRAIDLAGNCGPASTFSLLVDAAAESIAGLAARTQPGGALIAAATWQPDNDPYFEWAAPASVSPIVGYSIGTGTTTDCTSETTSAFHLYATDALSDGPHTFWVRALDEAGNCGAPATYTVWVDAAADPVTGLAAWTAAGGTAIPESTWQPDNDPYLTWTPATSVSPIVGYSVAVDASPDCTVGTTEPFHAFAPDGLADGVHIFRVSAIDEAGNCGPAAEFEIRVSTLPVARTGPDQTVDPSSVTLDGTGSHSPSAGTLVYHWTADAGNPAAVVFSENDSASASTTRVVLRRAGTYTFRLTVEDGSGTSDPDEGLVTVRNVPPVAWAGPTQVVGADDAVTLTAEWSTDANGDSLSYQWRQSAGPLVTLAGPRTMAPSFIAGSRAAVLGFEVVANDGTLDSAPAGTMVVVLDEPLSICTADAGPDQVVEVSAEVTLNGSAHCGVPSGTVTWVWTQVAGPLVTLDTTAPSAPRFSAPDAPAILTFELVTSDGGTNSPPDRVHVSVRDTAGGRQLPVADAGPDQLVAVHDDARLDGSGSTVDPGRTARWLWTQADGWSTPLWAGDTATPYFTPIEPGRYEFDLVVSDGLVDSLPDRTAVQAVRDGDVPPVADAGPDRHVETGTLVALDGSASTVGPGLVPSYQWWQSGGPWAVLGDPRTAAPTFTAHTAGTYVFALSVDDGTVTSAPDRVAVVAEDPVVDPDAGTDAGDADADVVEDADAAGEADIGADVVEDADTAGEADGGDDVVEDVEEAEADATDGGPDGPDTVDEGDVGPDAPTDVDAGETPGDGGGGCGCRAAGDGGASPTPFLLLGLLLLGLSGRRPRRRPGQAARTGATTGVRRRAHTGKSHRIRGTPSATIRSVRGRPIRT